MLSRLITSSVRGRVVVIALCGLLMAYGYRTVRTAPLDVFPEFAPPKVEVQTEAPGLSTEEVESLISVPLENALRWWRRACCTPPTTLQWRSACGWAGDITARALRCAGSA